MNPIEIDEKQYLVARIGILEDFNRTLQDQVAKLTVLVNMKDEEQGSTPEQA